MRCHLLGPAFVALLVGCSNDDGAPTTGTNTTAAANLKISETGCTDDSSCAEGVCFKGNAQAFCTFRCTAETTATVCVSPLTGTCNKQGYCKRD